MKNHPQAKMKVHCTVNRTHDARKYLMWITASGKTKKYSFLNEDMQLQQLKQDSDYQLL
jgi:hypothetical protein